MKSMMHAQRIMTIVAGGVVGIGFLMSGCATRTSGIEAGQVISEAPGGDSLKSNAVIVNNPGLARGLQVVDLRSTTEGDLIKAQVNLVNKYAKTVQFQYKFSWFDARGMEISPDGTAWNPVTLYGNESKTIQAVAPSAAAREFKVKLR